MNAKRVEVEVRDTIRTKQGRQLCCAVLLEELDRNGWTREDLWRNLSYSLETIDCVLQIGSMMLQHNAIYLALLWTVEPYQSLALALTLIVHEIDENPPESIEDAKC